MGTKKKKAEGERGVEGGEGGRQQNSSVITLPEFLVGVLESNDFLGTERVRPWVEASRENAGSAVSTPGLLVH